MISSPSSSSIFDLNQMATKRLDLIKRLNQNPQNFTATSYNKTNGLLASPYISINNPDLCCLINESCSQGKLTPTSKEHYLFEINGLKFVIKIISMSDPFMRFMVESPTSSKYINELLPESSCNYKNLSDYSYIATDEFTNEVLMGYLLDYILTQSQTGIKNYVISYDSTICSTKSLLLTYNKGILLQEHCDGGSLTSAISAPSFSNYLEIRAVNSNNQPINVNLVKSDTILNIFRQVITTLDFLQSNAHFVHGNLKTSNLMLKNEKYTNTYKGIKIDSPFTVKIADLTKSSLTINLTDPKTQKESPHRFYSYKPIVSLYKSISDFKPNIKMDSISGQYYYMVDNLLLSTLTAEISHMGLPFYQTFDTYTFIISFLLIPEVFRQIFMTPELKKLIWDPLWFPTDETTIYNLLISTINRQNDGSYETILNLLRGLRLKCQITSILVQLLSK